MPRSREQERELRERQARLSALTKHPSWEELQDEFERRKAAHLKSIAADLLGTEPIDQRKIDFYRGWWAGAAYLLRCPDLAEATLNQALAAANVKQEDDSA